MNDDGLIDRARAAAERDAAGLDAATRARLLAGRRAALDALDAPHRGAGAGWRTGWSPVGAAAAVALAAVGLTLSLRSPAPEAIAEPATELEVLLAEDDPALYDDDLEFYAWLDEQPDAD